MIAGLILAGGQSRRMGGGDKCLLPLGETTLLAHVIARLTRQVDRLALNANGDPARFAPYPLPILPDSLADYPGPRAGVLAGLDWATANDIPEIITVAADTPFFPTNLAKTLRTAARDEATPLAMAMTPRDGTEGFDRHPTFGLWPTNLRHDLRAALESGTRKVIAWTEPHGCARAIFNDPPAFFNVNTPDDLAHAQELAS